MRYTQMFELLHNVALSHNTFFLSWSVLICFVLCWPLQASIDSREDPSFRLDADETAQGQVYGTPMPPEKPENPEFSSGPCKKRPG